jgi:hypothetical protein
MDAAQCDEAKPSCGRCVKRKVKCIGSGQRRYMFKTSTPHSLVLHRSPESAIDSTTSALVNAIQLRDVRYAMAHFGPFFDELPARLGKSTALDASVKALLGARSVFVHRMPPSKEGLVAQGDSLRALREALGDPATAVEPETLCALYVNLLCQVRTYVPLVWPCRPTRCCIADQLSA